MKYRKKPVIVEAFRWTVDQVPQWWRDRTDISIDIPTTDALIPTIEGVMRVQPGDMIIQGVKGEIYPCKSDIFEMTYEPV